MTELVEALARAIARTYYDNSFYRNADGTRTTDPAALAMLERKIDEGWRYWSEHARAALAELDRQGYAVVPKEESGGGLYDAAKKLLWLAGQIDRASSEEEECHLCDQRDALLARFRTADAAAPKVMG